MCRSLLSVDWQGYVYDCDFNQMLGLPLKLGQKPRVKLRRSVGTRPCAAIRSSRRPLLRLYRRPGIELRRRAQS